MADRSTCRRQVVRRSASRDVTGVCCTRGTPCRRHVQPATVPSLCGGGHGAVSVMNVKPKTEVNGRTHKVYLGQSGSCFGGGSVACDSHWHAIVRRTASHGHCKRLLIIKKEVPNGVARICEIGRLFIKKNWPNAVLTWLPATTTHRTSWVAGYWPSQP